jgi:hypothetical protein
MKTWSHGSRGYQPPINPYPGLIDQSPDPPRYPPTSQVGPIENRSQFPTIPIFEKKKTCGFIRYIMHQKVTTIYNPILSWLNRHVFVKTPLPRSAIHLPPISRAATAPGNLCPLAPMRPCRTLGVGEE